jgi:hypothetical protein
MNLNQYGLKRSEVELLINEWIFNERNRSITKRKLLDGVTFEKLAEEYDLSVQQVKTIVYKCSKIIFLHL